MFSFENLEKITELLPLFGYEVKTNIFSKIINSKYSRAKKESLNVFRLPVRLECNYLFKKTVYSTEESTKVKMCLIFFNSILV
jgi:hypothetical protein